MTWSRLRRVLHERRIGHTGTLDPMATGVLLLVVGRATRLAKFLSASDKSYEAVVRLGFATDTADAEGQPIGPVSTRPLPAREVDRGRARRVSRHLPAAAAGVFGEEDRRDSAATSWRGRGDARARDDLGLPDAPTCLTYLTLPDLPALPALASVTAHATRASSALMATHGDAQRGLLRRLLRAVAGPRPRRERLGIGGASHGAPPDQDRRLHAGSGGRRSTRSSATRSARSTR